MIMLTDTQLAILGAEVSLHLQPDKKARIHVLKEEGMNTLFLRQIGKQPKAWELNEKELVKDAGGNLTYMGNLIEIN